MVFRIAIKINKLQINVIKLINFCYLCKQKQFNYSITIKVIINFTTAVIKKCVKSSTYIVKFVVQSAGITHRLSVLVAPPKRRRRRLAIRTTRARSPGCTLETLYRTEKET